MLTRTSFKSLSLCLSI